MIADVGVELEREDPFRNPTVASVPARYAQAMAATIETSEPANAQVTSPARPEPPRPQPSAVGFARWLIIPFALGGLAFLAAVPLRLAVVERGRPITASVDWVDVGRDVVTPSLHFHYRLDGRRWDDSQFVTKAEASRLHAGQALTGRTIILLGRSVALTSAGDVPVQTAWLIATAAVVNGLVGAIVYVNFVAPWRAGRRRSAAAQPSA